MRAWRYLAIVFALIASSGWAQETRLVESGGSDVGDCVIEACESIQYAIDQSSAGDSIEVGAGTYVGEVHVHVDHLTLVSNEGADETVIDADDAINAVEIGEHDHPGNHPDGVTIQGFQVINWVERGISQRNGTGTVYIRDNIVLGPESGARNGINISGGTGSEVTGNVILTSSFDQEDWSGSGILAMGSVNALIEDNLISGPDIGVSVVGGHAHIDPSWGQASGNIVRNNTITASSSGAIGLQGDASGTLIEDNELVDNNRGIEVSESGHGAYPSDVEVRGNFIADNGAGIVFFDPGSHDPGQLTVEDNVFEGNQFNFWDATGTIDEQDFEQDNEINQLVRLVATDGEDSGNCSEDACLTIQYAVNQAAPGDTISIASGTYREQVGIGKSLTIDAEPGAVMEAPDMMSVIEFPESSAEWAPMMLIYGGSLSSGEITGSSVIDVDVSGLEFDGRDIARSERYPAVLYRNANGLIANNSIHSMGNLEGNKSFGVSVYGDSIVEVEGNHITGYGRGGIGIQGSEGGYPHPHGLVVDNTLVGVGYGEDQSWGANGIQVAWGATGGVMGNSVTGGWHENATVAGVFIGLGSDDVIVADNQLVGNGAGVQVYDASGTEITGNVIEDGDYGMDIGDGNIDTVIDGNEIRNQFLDGILVWTQSDPIVNTQITNNLIEMSDWGLTLFVNEPGEINGIDVSSNQFVDNNRQLVDSTNLLDEQDFVATNTFDISLTLDLTIGLPSGLASGSGWAGFTAQLASVGEVPENVVLWIETDGLDDAAYSQGLRVEYFDGSDWQHLGWGGASHWQLNRDAFFLGRDETQVVGFPIEAGTDDLIPLRVNWPNDTYAVTATLESVDSGDGAGDPGERIWLDENYLLDVNSTAEGAISLTADGFDASGQTLVQGNATDLVIAVEDIVLPDETELAVVFDGQRPGDTSPQPGEGVCADLFGTDDCQGLGDAIGFGSLIEEDGSQVMFDGPVSLQADADPGQWLLRFFLVENDGGAAGTLVHQLDVDITVEAASGRIAGTVEVTGIGAPDLPIDSLEVSALQGGDVIASDLTDGAGSYSLDGLVGGTYTVEVATVDGFGSASAEVTLASSTDESVRDFLLESTVDGDIAVAAGGLTIDDQTFAAGRSIEGVALDAMRNDGGADLDFYVSLLVFDDQWQQIDYISAGLFTQQTLTELSDVLGPDNSFTLGGNDMQSLLSDATLELGENADELGVSVMRFRLIDDRFGDPGNRIKHVEANFDVSVEPQDELDIALTGFETEYQQGGMETGSEQVVFDYAANAGDIEQVFNVFRLYEGGTEIDPETYEEIFESVEFVPAQIRGLSGTDASVVTAPGDLDDVSVQFLLAEDAPLGDYEIVITSYDVTGIDPNDVALGDTGTYRVLDTTSQGIGLIQGPDLSLAVDGPALLPLAEEGYYDVRLQNLGDAPVSENVEVQFSIARPDIAQGDALVDYCIDETATSGEDCGEWVELTLTADNGSLSGRFGPPEGFEVDENYDRTTFIRAAFTEPGNYDATAQAVGVDSDEVYATGMTEVAITEASFEIEAGVDELVPAPDEGEGWAYYTATLVNLGDELPENVALWIEVDGIDDALKDGEGLEIEYFNGSEWQRLGWAGQSSFWYGHLDRDAWFLGRPDDADGTIEGFPVGAGESFPTPIRVNFDNDTYDLTVSVETADQDADPIWVYGLFEEQILVESTAVDLSLAIVEGLPDPALDEDGWAGFTANLINDGGAVPENVLLWLEVDGIDNANVQDLTLQYYNPAINDWSTFGWGGFGGGDFPEMSREAFFIGRDGSTLVGFEIPAGYDEFIPLRVDWPNGSYQVTTSIESFEDVAENNPGDRIYLSQADTLGVVTDPAGTLAGEVNGVDADGQSLTVGDVFDLALLASDVLPRTGKDLFVIFDGQRPSDSSGQPGEAVCEDLLGSADCAAIGGAIGFANPLESGDSTLFEDAVSIRADAELGTWTLSFYLVEALEDGEGGSTPGAVLDTLSVELTVEEATLALNGLGTSTLSADFSTEVLAMGGLYDGQSPSAIASSIVDAGDKQAFLDEFFAIYLSVDGTPTQVPAAALDAYGADWSQVLVGGSDDSLSVTFEPGVIELDFDLDQGNTGATRIDVEWIGTDAFETSAGGQPLDGPAAADNPFKVEFEVAYDLATGPDYGPAAATFIDRNTLLQRPFVTGIQFGAVSRAPVALEFAEDVSAEVTYGGSTEAYISGTELTAAGSYRIVATNDGNPSIEPGAQTAVEFEIVEPAGTIVATADGVALDGQSIVRGDSTLLDLSVTDVDAPLGAELAVVFDGFAPGDTEAQDGNLICDQLLKAADCAALDAAIGLDNTFTADTALFGNAVTVLETAAAGEWTLRFFLVEVEGGAIVNTVSQLDATIEVLEGADLALAIGGPALLPLAEEGYYDVRLQNLGDAPVSENVEVQFSIARPDIAQGDALVDYCIDETATSGEDCGEWAELTLTADNGSLSGRFGPPEGFEVDENYDRTTFIRAAFTEPGNYDATAQAVGVDSDEVYATGMTEVAITELSFDIAEGVPTGVPDEDEGWAYYTATLVNFGDELPENVLLWIDVDGIGDVEFAGGASMQWFNENTGQWTDFAWGDHPDLDPMIQREAFFLGRDGSGNVTGFPIGDDEVFETPVRVNFENAIYDFSTSVEGTDGEWVYGQFEDEVAVISDAIDLDFEIERGVAAPDQPPRWDYFTATLSNVDGGATPDNIVLYVAIDETDFAAGDALEFWNGNEWQNFGWDGVREAWFLGRDGAGDVSGFPIDADEMFEIEIRVNFLPDEYAGTITVESFDDSIVGVGGMYAEFLDTVDVLPTQADITFDPADLVQAYDGTEKSVGVTTAPEAGLDVEIVFDPAPPVNAGSYVVNAVVVDPFFEGSATTSLLIEKGEATVNLTDLVQTYDSGNPLPVTVETAPSGLDVVVTYDGSSEAPSETGSYSVFASVDDANWSGSASGLLVIEPATADVSLDGLEQTYDGTPREVTATTAPAGLSVHITYDGQSQAPVDAGSYEVVATVDDANHVGTITETLVVAQAEVDEIQITDLEQTYDGEPKPVTVTTVPAGLDVVVTYDGDTTPPVDAGSYLVEVEVVDNNYFGSADVTLVVAQGSQTIDFPGLPDRSVDDSPFTISASASSELDVAFSVVSGPATADGNTVTLTGELGEVVIEAAQAGDDNWLAADPVQQSFEVVEGDGNTIEAVSATTIGGEAGEPVDTQDLPTVRVLDQADNPVPGVTVSFEVTSGGGSVSGATQVTDSDGLAQVGGWVLGSDATQTLTASAPGLAGSPVEFTAEVDAVVNLDVSITDNRDTIEPGERNTYVVVVSNDGPNEADGAEVSVELPSELVADSADWVCYAGQGASCTESGTGGILDDAVTLAAGASAIYVLEADVEDQATGIIAVMATVALNDVSASDVTTTQIVITEDSIFQDRFEDDTEPGIAVSAGAASYIEGHLTIDNGFRGGLPPRVLLGGRDGNGNDVFRMRSLVFSDLSLVRIEMRDDTGTWTHGDWFAMQPAEEGVLGFEYDANSGLLMLVGDRADNFIQTGSRGPKVDTLFSDAPDQVDIAVE